MNANNKKLVKFNGGLGNQMFQYAFAYALSKKFNLDVMLDFTWFDAVKTHVNVTPREFGLGVFDLKYNVASKEDLEKVVELDDSSFLRKAIWKYLKIKKFQPKKNIVRQKIGYNFEREMFSNNYYYYDGYFQNENYFKHLRTDILKCFSLKESIDEKNQSVLNIIKSTNSVSLHVRRGDYVTLECAKNFHGLCCLNYYEKAISYIGKNVKNPHFFLFSDDIEWVVQNLKLDYPYTVIDFNKDKSYLDMELMKNCKHNIVANSSFSWWGAWLNDNPNKIVVAPRKWVAQKMSKCDVVPKSWIKF